LIGLALYYDVFHVKGSYYHLDEESWHGRASLEEQLRWDLTLQDRLRDHVFAVVTKGRRVEAEATAPTRRLRRKS
jgi:hypothetical protein